MDRPAFGRLLAELARRGYAVIGPTLRGGAIVLDHVEGLEDLPRGLGSRHGPGVYSLLRRDDDRLFGQAPGPDSAKRFLFPPRERLATVSRPGGRLTVDRAADGEPPRYAFVGLRACDLQAVLIQDRVFLGGPYRDEPYEARRDGAFFLAANCTDPGQTCFCTSTGTGPWCRAGFDVAVTEIDGGMVAEVGTAEGREVLDAAGAREASPDEIAASDRAVRQAADRIDRRPDLRGIGEVLYRNAGNPVWDEIAERCLACGNCTAVCPTCFCHDVVDTASITGQEAERSREWASCFSEEFTHVAGGSPIRASGASRYRQWLTHKFASWRDQFGVPGCVGCGRCVTWCPAGIDILEVLAAIRARDGERDHDERHRTAVR
ncbi:MAG: 4Fe-4S dicluster domain-containing protein [Actinobacteria bacterium]|nr:4Fe-4S dicluster domain-containing protein [Actinomycetota bacterium]